MLAFMAMPTIVSIAEDALYSVPKSYKEGAFALGATHWETIWRVMLPAASTHTCRRHAGDREGYRRDDGSDDDYRKCRRHTDSILVPVRTLTATIAAEMGKQLSEANISRALRRGIVLFNNSFFINVTADLFLHKRQS